MTPQEQQKVMAKVISIPSGYAKFRLGVKLHPKQAEVLDSLFPTNGEQSKVGFLCGNGLGKTAIVSSIAVLYSLEMLQAKIVATSATYRQLTGQLIPALKAFAHLYPKWEFLENKIKIDGEDRFIAFSTQEQAKWQGWHTTDKHRLFIITDESAGLHDDVFQSISRCSPYWLLVAGSPLSPQGFFYSLFTDTNTGKSFKKYKFSKYEALKENGWWIDRKEIEEMESMYGKQHPLVLSSVYAEFSSQIENGLIALEELNKCYEFPPKEMGTELHVGCDVAAGGDSNCIALRRGNKIEVIDTWYDTDTMQACSKIVMHLNNLKEKYNLKANEVSLDADGMGIAFIHRLKDLGWVINEFHGNATPDNDRYSNKISECWFDIIQRIKNCSIILPDNKDYRLQLLSRKQQINDKGKLKLESKKDMKARGISSPDIADAVAISMSNPKSGNVTQAFKLNVQPRQYSYF